MTYRPTPALPLKGGRKDYQRPRIEVTELPEDNILQASEEKVPVTFGTTIDDDKYIHTIDLDV